MESIVEGNQECLEKMTRRVDEESLKYNLRLLYRTLYPKNNPPKSLSMADFSHESDSEEEEEEENG